ncbi:hypothetical protein [Streptomyces europaeiscabiei]|uniref:hypothetical protein n=1 Tax=Streptomyces europaeiscabiei TaxID=146819 RepID=UPI0038F6FEDF
MLVIVSGYSRMIAARMLPSRQAADLVSGHWDLLSGWNAVPRALVWDNEPAIGRRQEGRAVLGHEFAALAGLPACEVILCRPRDPEAKHLSSHCTSSGRCGVLGIEDGFPWSADDGPDQVGAGQGVEVLALVVGQDAGDDAVPAPVLDGLEVDIEVSGEFADGQQSGVEQSLAVAA